MSKNKRQFIIQRRIRLLKKNYELPSSSNQQQRLKSFDTLNRWQDIQGKSIQKKFFKWNLSSTDTPESIIYNDKQILSAC